MTLYEGTRVFRNLTFMKLGFCKSCFNLWSFIEPNLPWWWLSPIMTMIISASLLTDIDHGAEREEHLKLIPRWDKEIWGEAGFIFQPADIKRIRQQLAVHAVSLHNLLLDLQTKISHLLWHLHTNLCSVSDLDATFTFWTQRLTLETWDPSDI